MSQALQEHPLTAKSDSLLIESALSIAIVKQAVDAIIATRLDGKVITWNSGAERIFGYDAAEMVGRSITDLFPPDLLLQEGELIAQLESGATISHFATRRIRKDGATIDVSVTLSPIRDGSGKIIAVSTVARDITETHKRHVAAELSAVIIEQSDDAIISETIDGTILTWNLGAEHIFGYTAAEITGGPITQLFPADRSKEEADLIAILQVGGKISHFETQRIRKDGALINVSVSLSPVRDPSGKIVAVSNIARDITEKHQQYLIREARDLRERNQQLEQSNRDLEDFAYIASHDLKSPLNGINSAALWLEEDLHDSLSAESRKLLELMRSRINRMEMLLDDLLAFSRVGRTDTTLGEMNLADVFAAIIEVLNPPPHIRVRVEGELPVVVTAGAQLEQVLRNLIGNAIKHHDKQAGEVVLSAKSDGDHVEFSVRDDGPGILPQFHEKVFQLFQTLKRRDEVEGTGMGLAIVKKLVERKNCRVTIHSEGNGKGTEFRFRWPALPSTTGEKRNINA